MPNRKRSRSRRPPARIYKTKPSGRTHVAYDAARDAHQARALHRSYPRDMRPIIVKTGPSRGKNKHTFPYHIYVPRGRA